jgi:hypothetical protein
MMAKAQLITRATHSESLPEVLERVLDKGLVIAGDIKIKLCNVELLSIQIRLLVCSVDKAREMGLTWWWQESAHALPAPHQNPPCPLSQSDPTRDQWQEFMRSKQPAQS